MKDNSPNFFIVGAAKSGTTSFARYLSQHPDVFMSTPKEPNYYAFEDTDYRDGPASAEVLNHILYSYSVEGIDEYKAIFARAKSETAIGEASVRYLYFSRCAERLAEQNPSAKILILLRNPVDRLYSHFNMNRQMLLEPLSLEEAIASEKDRISMKWGWDWHYVSVSKYAAQVERFYTAFPRQNVKIIFYDSLTKNIESVLRETFEFLSVDPEFEPNVRERGMVSSLPRSKRLARWLVWPNNATKIIGKIRPIGPSFLNFLSECNRAPIPDLDMKQRKLLSDMLRHDVMHLELIIGEKVPTTWLNS